MDNYKVKVENEAESKEVQELFFELGCHWYYNGKQNIENVIGFINSHEDMSLTSGSILNSKHKELTIPQLKDLVVLKRNDIGDATHEAKRCKFYVSENSVFEYIGVDGWKDTSDYIEDFDLKPIEKKEHKEFLVNHDGKWTLQLLDADTEENSYLVAVPKDATHYSEGKYSGNGVFLKVDGINQYEYYNDIWLLRCNPLNEMYFTTQLLWQRSETGYLMQGANGDKLMESIAELKNQETVKVTIDELKHRVYKKDVSHLDSIDVYRVLELFNVQSHAVGHAIKKLLCSGGRGAKDEAQDIQEAIDSLVRYQEMKNEDYVLFDS